MKLKTASVTWKVLAGLAAVVFFGIMVVEGAGLQRNGVCLRAVSNEEILSADGPVPPPPQWPTPKTMVKENIVRG